MEGREEGDIEAGGGGGKVERGEEGSWREERRNIEGGGLGGKVKRLGRKGKG